MKLNKLAQISTISLVITTILLIGTNFDYSHNPKMRYLTEEETVKEICLKAPQKLQDFYFSHNNTFYTDVKPNKYVPILKAFIETNEIKDLIDYLPRLIPFAVFIDGWYAAAVVAVLAVVADRKKTKIAVEAVRLFFLVLCTEESLLEPWQDLFIQRILVILLFIRQFVEGINGTTCSIMKFNQELQKGEVKGTIPKWIGIEGIKSTLTKTINSVEHIQTDANEVYNETFLKEGENQFIKELTDNFDAITIIKFDNPDPKVTEKIAPIYISNYGPYNRQNTILNQIYENYDVVINKGVSEMNETKSMTDQIKTSGTEIITDLETAKTSVDELSSTFDNMAGKIIDDWVIYQQYFNDYSYLGLYVFFGVLLGFGVLSLTIMILYVCKCSQCIRGILHLLWNLFALLSIISFLIGSVIGLVGVVGTDGSSLFSFVFSAENMDSDNPFLFTFDETIKTCLTGDGDLSKTLGLSVGDTSVLDDLYNMSSTIKSTQAELGKHTEMESVIIINSEFDKISNNFKLTGIDAVNALIELNKYTNANAPSSYQRTTDASKYDTWVANINDCLSVSNCYVVSSSNGSEDKIANDYYSLTELKNTNKYPTVPEAVTAYLISLNKFEGSNKAELEKLKNINSNEFNSKYKDQFTELNKTLERVEKLINPLIETYDEVVGDNSIFSMVNCKFVQKNLNLFLTVMQEGLGDNATIFGAIILAISFCEALSIIFVLIVIHRYKVKPESVQQTDMSDQSAIIPKSISNELDKQSNEEVKPEDIPVTILEKADL